eukprot:252985_1
MTASDGWYELTLFCSVALWFLLFYVNRKTGLNPDFHPTRMWYSVLLVTYIQGLIIVINHWMCEKSNQATEMITLFLGSIFLHFNAYQAGRSRKTDKRSRCYMYMTALMVVLLFFLLIFAGIQSEKNAPILFDIFYFIAQIPLMILVLHSSTFDPIVPRCVIACDIVGFVVWIVIRYCELAGLEPWGDRSPYLLCDQACFYECNDTYTSRWVTQGVCFSVVLWLLAYIALGIPKIMGVHVIHDGNQTLKSYQRSTKPCHGYRTMILYHVTDRHSAKSIHHNNLMIRGESGLFGGGIYFAETIDVAMHKAHHEGYVITAEVMIGNEFTLYGYDHRYHFLTFTELWNMGYDSVHAPNGAGLSLLGECERVVYNCDQINILRIDVEPRCFGISLK